MMCFNLLIMMRNINWPNLIASKILNQLLFVMTKWGRKRRYDK